MALLPMWRHQHANVMFFFLFCFLQPCVQDMYLCFPAYVFVRVLRLLFKQRAWSITFDRLSMLQLLAF